MFRGQVQFCLSVRVPTVQTPQMSLILQVSTSTTTVFLCGYGLEFRWACESVVNIVGLHASFMDQWVHGR